MKRIACVVVLVAACTSSAGSDLPAQPTVTVPGTAPPPAVLITGRACLVAIDPRALFECAAAGAGGLVVALGSNSTTTLDDGSFSLQTPGGASGMLQISGAGIASSAQAVGAINLVPAISSDLFAQMLADNEISLAPSTGSIIASVTNAEGQPIAGVTATSIPSASSGPFFDGTEPTQFGQSETGNSGIVFFPGLTTLGPTTLGLTDSAGLESTVDGVQVFDGGITYVAAPIP
ncbi:MAG TPA: hypothetical protein VGF94_05200 [Kofleriaceae bacterium]|jgi:hypothetical protein